MLRNIFDAIPSFITTLIKLFLLEFFILEICRVVFYFGYRTLSVSDVDSETIIKAFVMGLEFDMVATTYSIFLPAVLLLFDELFHKRTAFFRRTAFIFSLVIFWIYAFISAADFPYYHQFNSHLNKQAFLWAASPAFVLKLIFGTISYYGYLLIFIFGAILIYKVLRKIYAAHQVRVNRLYFKPLRVLLALIVLVPFLIVGARGRIAHKSTTHEGMAIVSDNLFINQVALNPNFTFFRSALFHKVKGYKIPDDIDASIAFARDYFQIKGPYSRSIARQQTADSAFRPFNVVIVCMESMSSYKMGIHGRENLTPNFNALINESVYFDNFFSSGIHTFNGLFSTCAGYPGMLTEHALRRYVKKPFTTLGNLLQQKNYQTYLAVTHDPVFDNMEGFFRLNGYDHTLSSNDLPGDKAISVTGVPDHELFKLFISKINASGKSKPFLGFIMTGSDHGPWAIPGDIPFKPTANTDEKRSTQYADWSIGEFMNEAKKQDWYNNTLFVFLGDHGYSIDGTYEMPLSYNHIPLVLHKPSTLKPQINHNPGYQPDVISTVAGVLNLSFNNTTFGIDILKEKHPFVYFTADDKIGAISGDGFFYYDLITQKTKRLKKYENLDQADYYESNKLKADSLAEGARKMLDAAEYFIRNEYFSY